MANASHKQILMVYTVMISVSRCLFSISKRHLRCQCLVTVQDRAVTVKFSDMGKFSEQSSLCFVVSQ